MVLAEVPGIAGCDEAGRGPLAGPVVCAAVILPEPCLIMGLADSKAISRARREVLELQIVSACTYTITFIEPEEIDRLNILRASLEGMRRCIEALPRPLAGVIVDGDRLPPGLTCPAEAWVKGDSRHHAVSAASILAKVARDRFMVDCAAQFPEYGFEKHFGYPTPDHLAALNAYGPCPIHRASFAPVSQARRQGVLF